MDAKVRRKLEMGLGVREFSRANPHPDPGYNASLQQLDKFLEEGRDFAGQERKGTLDVRTSTVRKGQLRKTLKEGPLSHVVAIGQVAAREVMGLEVQFVMRPDTDSHQSFRTAARGIEADARTWKDLLVKHGLAESALDSLTKGLDEFDAAIELTEQGRRAHIGASAELKALAKRIVGLVKALDGFNRLRFADDPERLAAWKSASSVVATPVRQEQDELDSDVQPAA